jgi:hypothetical protein
VARAIDGERLQSSYGRIIERSGYRQSVPLLEIPKCQAELLIDLMLSDVAADFAIYPQLVELGIVTLGKVTASIADIARLALRNAQEA